MELRIKLLDKNCMPTKGHADDAGIDLRARIPKLISIGQHQTIKIPTGICVDIPKGHMGDVRPRSGLSSQGIVAEIGTIDCGYTGEIVAIITNNSSTPFHINPYDRIGQLVVTPISVVHKIVVVDKLDIESERGENGFGSTGIK